MKLYNANTIRCAIYHMSPHFVMHFHVVLYTFLAPIGTWLWCLRWSDRGVIFEMSTTTYRQEKALFCPPPPSKMTFFYWDVVFLLMGLKPRGVRRTHHLLWYICLLMLNSLFCSYHHTCLPVTLESSSLGPLLLLEGFRPSLSLSWETDGLPTLFLTLGFRVLARAEFFFEGSFHVLSFFLIFSYGHNGDYISVYLTTSFSFSFFFLPWI